MDARGRLLGDASDLIGHLRPDRIGGLVQFLEHGQHAGELLVVRGGRVLELARRFEVGSPVDEQGRIATVVEDQIRSGTVAPMQGLEGAPPVFLEGLTLPGEHGDAGGGVGGSIRPDGNGRGGVVLRGEDVAAGPADFGAQLDEGLDQHGGLDRHVQRSGDACALEGLGVFVAVDEGHESGHLVFGQLDFLATEGHQFRIEALDLERLVSEQWKAGIHECGAGCGGGEAHEGSLQRGMRVISSIYSDIRMIHL